MPLHLNLYHEVQKQKALRRRDPLKLGLYGLAAIAACFAGYYFLQLGKASSVTSEYRRVQAEHSTLAPKADLAKKRSEEIAAMLETSKKMVGRMEERLYWAPILETLTQTVPANIQLTRFAGNAQGDSKKRCNITIDGVAAGDEPRQVAEELRRAISEKYGAKFASATATFKSLEDSAETAKQNGRDARTAIFSIEIQLHNEPSEPAAALGAAKPAAAAPGA
jgi:Tfp pilus assembly protein PilN